MSIEDMPGATAFVVVSARRAGTTPPMTMRAQTVADVLTTEQLAERPTRRPDHAGENRWLHRLAGSMSTEDPGQVQQRLLDAALELCGAGSAGISLLDRDAGVFRWTHLAGAYAGFVGGTTPGGFSPCGTCLELGAPQLFDRPARLFTYLDIQPTLMEGLVIPFQVGGEAVGTVWIAAHDQRRFDREDVRVMESLAAFCASAIGLGRALRAERVTSAELIRSNARLERFAFVASHDLQEPLRMITGYLALLRRRLQGVDDKARSYLTRASDGARQVRGMVEAILAYSRATAEAPAPALIDSRAAFDQAVANLARPIAEQAALVGADGLPMIRADHHQLVRVFQNLIANAIRFRGTPPPQVRVSATGGDGAWEFAVSDNGIGIPAHGRDRLFTLFGRLHGPERPGVGIGLATCRDIVERHGGRIWVDDAAPGPGATIRFTIPTR